jgi:Polyketide cyclase / dehydrase and lipid transport
VRSDTRTITIGAPRDDVFAFLADPTNLPSWAPAFASAVHRDGDDWIVVQGPIELRLRVAADLERGTVDLHVTPPDGTSRTAYGRVLPNGDGAEYLFTLFHSDSRSDEQVARQAAEMEEELRRVKTLCELR